METEWDRIRNLQYEYNRRRIHMLERPTIRWTINKEDVQKPSDTMVFRRFPGLIVPELELDILVKVLLGIPEVMGYKFSNSCAILDDSGMVGIKQEGGIMMESFLKGFDGKSDELKKLWQEKQLLSIDVSEELKDLMKVYTDAEEVLVGKEKSALDLATSYMKRYIEAQEERKKISHKLSSLKHKMSKKEEREEELAHLTALCKRFGAPFHPRPRPTSAQCSGPFG